MAPFLAAAAVLAAAGCLKTPEPEKDALHGSQALRERKRELGPGDPREAREMAETLRKLARESKESVPSLVRALGDDDEDARRVAASQLIVIGARDRSVIPQLVGALRDESEHARGQAADALWTIAPAEEKDVPRLLRELASPAPDVHLRAAFALGMLRDESSPYLLGIEDDDDSDDRKKRRDAEVAALAKALGDEDGHVRYYAALALSRRRGREAAPALERLRGVLTDEYAPTRAAAVSALGAIAYHVKADLDARLIMRNLTEALTDEAAPVRVAAVSALGSIASHLTLAETDLDARPAMQALTEVLTDEAAPVRVAAVSALGTIAADAVAHQTELDIRPLVQRLIEALTDKDALVRKQAAEDLEETGAKAAVPSLLRALKDESAEVRCVAAGALSEIVPDTPDAVGPLAEALKDSESSLPWPAAETLGKMGRTARAAIPALARALGGQDDFVREYAAKALGQIAAWDVAGDETLALNDAETGAAVSALVGVLGDDDEDVRSNAVWALAAIGPRAAPAVPALVARFEEKTGSARLMLARAIEEITPGTGAATSALVASLGDEDGEVGTDAAWDLAKKGKKGLPLLTKALRDGDARARASAAAGLGWLARKRTLPAGGFSDTPVGDEDETLARGLGRADVEAIISALAAALGDADAKVREYAAHALGDIGSAAASALADIVRAVGDPEGKVRRGAVWALEGLGKKAASALPLVTKALKDPHERVRVHAVMALEKIAPDSDEWIPALAEALYDDSPNISLRAARVLARKGAAAVPSLVEALKSNKLGARRAAADGLSQMGPECAPAGRALVAALGDPDDRVRWNAAVAVRKARPEARDAVPALIRMFEQETGCPQESAARTLASYGAEARSAIPALVKALRALEKTFKECKRENPTPAVGALRWIGTDWWNWVPVVGALGGIGPDEETARMLFDLELPDDWGLEMAVFKALAGHPDLALAYMRAHPKVMATAYDEADFLAGLVRRREAEYAELIRAVVDHENFPVKAMVRLGDRAFIPRIREIMKKADAHRLTYLEACLRALGEPADRVVRISETERSDFQPLSYTGIDQSRREPGVGGHGSGQTEVVVTGRILMPDGAPAVSPRFYDVNDRYMLGMRVKEAAEITYDAKTGRFVYITSICAGYCPGKHREPGPYETGSALVLIEAGGAKPLRAQFFDEMPEVDITLSRAE